MEKYDIVILLCVIILLFLYNSNKKILRIDKKNIYKNNDIKIVNKNIDIKKNIYKNIDIKTLNGQITRQTLLNEIGGSEFYNKFQILSNISGNTIEQKKEYSTYAKTPTKLNK